MLLVLASLERGRAHNAIGTHNMGGHSMSVHNMVDHTQTSINKATLDLEDKVALEDMIWDGARKK